MWNNTGTASYHSVDRSWVLGDDKVNTLQLGSAFEGRWNSVRGRKSAECHSHDSILKLLSEGRLVPGECRMLSQTQIGVSHYVVHLFEVL